MEDINDLIIRYKNLIDDAKRELNELYEQAEYCPSCQKFYPKKQIEKLHIIKKNCKGCNPSLVDSDDDEIYDCDYDITNYKCPLCGSLDKKKSYPFNIRNRKHRWELN